MKRHVTVDRWRKVNGGDRSDRGQEDATLQAGNSRANLSCWFTLVCLDMKLLDHSLVFENILAFCRKCKHYQ